MIYIDTSAFLALFDADDLNHVKAKTIFHKILDKDIQIITSDAVLFETTALLQRRLGIEAVKDFQKSIFPLMTIVWTDQPLYHSGIASVLTANRKNLSLTDCISFEIMRQFSVNDVFCFDIHFKDQGFNVLS